MKWFFSFGRLCRSQDSEPAPRRGSASLTVEHLEVREVPAAFYVAVNGSDSAAGTLASPWRTLQKAANSVHAGDTVVAEYVNGQTNNFAGFQLTTSGTATSRITFHADSGVVINSRNSATADGINLEGVSNVTIEGFTVINCGRAGIRVVGEGDNARSDGVILQNNVTDNNARWGIFTGFTDDLLIQNNECSRSQTEHGIYVSNGSDRVTIRDNYVWGNNKNGIQMNGDVNVSTQDGVMSNILVEGNRIYNNGAGGGFGINADGVRDSVFQNNLIYGSYGGGIALFRLDSRLSTSNNLIVNNTVAISADHGRAALNLKDGSTGNTVYNNILLVSGGESVEISDDSKSGLLANNNILGNEFVHISGSGAETTLTLSGWKQWSGQDANSFTASPTQLFVNYSGNDLHLSSTSPAIDKGTGTGAPTSDLADSARPQGNGFDIGAYEYLVSGPADTTPPQVASKTPAAGATGVATTSAVTVVFSEAVQSATISFVLKNAAGTVIPATVSYNSAANSATLTPNSALAGGGTYTATVSGAKDLAGNALAGPTTWSFTTATAAVNHVWHQANPTDFNSGTYAGTALASSTTGGVQLASTLSDDFSGTVLSSTWARTNWASGASVTLTGGIVSVAQAGLLSAQSAGNSGVEGYVSFGASPYQHFGLATGLATVTGNSWAMFSTAGTSNTLFARVNTGGKTQDVNLGTLPTGFHTYRVTPVSGGFQFSVDGQVRTTISATMPTGTSLKVALSAYNSTAVRADWIRLLSYPASGTFTSSVFDATEVATWGSATWTTNLPAGTTVVVETRSGNTAAPDSSWSDWATVSSGGTVSSSAARFLQYRITLTTTNPTQTPVVLALDFNWN